MNNFENSFQSSITVYSSNEDMIMGSTFSRKNYMNSSEALFTNIHCVKESLIGTDMWMRYKNLLMALYHNLKSLEYVMGSL